MTHTLGETAPGRKDDLLGRRDECAVLDGMIGAVRGGRSHALVVHGETGVGKSALLGRAAQSATGLRVLRAIGIESESELAFATLHQLCVPLLDRLGGLPAPQQAALERAFGMRDGGVPERLPVALAVLGLLTPAARECPLLCVVDDGHWMDRASAQVLGLVARRLPPESTGLVFGVRKPAQELLGLPELEIHGIPDADARALLDSVTHSRLDSHIRDRIVGEARGNPRTLLDLPRGLTATELAGGLGLLHAAVPADRIGRRVLCRIEDLPEEARLLVLIAAAEPVGDPALVWRAAGRVGVTPVAALTPGLDELVSFGVRVTFRDPLIRPAVYRSATEHDRQTAHLALAEVADPLVDPDRRAWHFAAAAARPDESVAAGLVRSARRARTRGGLACAAAFLRRSVELTADPSRRVDRAIAAAESSLRAGDLDTARTCAGIADRDARDDLQRARTQLLRSRLDPAAGREGNHASSLLASARRLEPWDEDLARQACLLAWGTSALVAADSDGLMAASRAMRALPPTTRTSSPLDLVTEGCALLVIDGHAAAAPVLRRAAAALAELPAHDVPVWSWVAGGVAAAVWDDRAMTAVSGRTAEAVRAAGALTELPLCLFWSGLAATWTGDFAAAEAIGHELARVAATTGRPAPPHVGLRLGALRGREPEAEPLIAAALEDDAGTPSMRGTVAHWAAAVLYNGLARYERALPAARAASGTGEVWVSMWVLPELVEAAVRSGDERAARDAVERLARATKPYDTDWARGVLARSRALLSEEASADRLYREAIDRLGRTGLRPELARAHLLYGEWLRRERQRIEARKQLRTAHGMFVSTGMEAFAERTRRELLATGETIRRHGADASWRGALTPQEKQIVLLVQDGLSNPEIAAQLFLSPRTVEWHLGKVFTKLSITSRRELRNIPPGAGLGRIAG
ncbi:AAA family ATPase [Streptomyces sp. NPDC047841]|uniref:helix-turn-helix transcriptional regulator n=1 Tax=Streptomyces sp. NPDC047841 TaxID=3154708 RepID=UPI0034561163